MRTKLRSELSHERANAILLRQIFLALTQGREFGVLKASNRLTGLLNPSLSVGTICVPAKNKIRSLGSHDISSTTQPQSFMSSLSSLGVKITYLFLIPSLLIAREPEPISRVLVIGLKAAFRVNETLVRLNDRPRLMSECQFDWFRYGFPRAHSSSASAEALTLASCSQFM